MRKLTDINFVAMDVVEVSPPYDHAEITSGAAASLIMEYLCLQGLAARRAVGADPGMRPYVRPPSARSLLRMA